MISNFLSVYLTLLIPITIVYFQENKRTNERYFGYFFSIKKYAIDLIIIVAMYFMFSILDQFDIPSKVSKYFINKQQYMPVLISFYIFICILQICRVYIKYYNFRKLENSKKIDLLFLSQINKFEKIQKKYKWQQVNKDILKYNDSKYHLLYDHFCIVYKNEKMENRVIYSIKTDKIFRQDNELYLNISPGKQIHNGRVLAYVKNEKENHKKLYRLITKNIILGSDHEHEIEVIINMKIHDLINSCDSNDFIFFKKEIRTLLFYYRTIAESTLIFNDYISILKQLYDFMNNNIDKNESITYIFKRFNQQIFLSAITENNIKSLELYIDLCFNYRFLEISDGNNVINQGLLVFLYKVLYQYAPLMNKDLKIVETITIKLLFIALELTENEKKDFLLQIRRKSKLFNNEKIEKLSYGVQLFFSFIKDEKTLSRKYYQEQIELIENINGIIDEDSINQYLSSLLVNNKKA